MVFLLLNSVGLRVYLRAAASMHIYTVHPVKPPKNTSPAPRSAIPLATTLSSSPSSFFSTDPFVLLSVSWLLPLSTFCAL